jgi:hypothetical protein
LAAGAYTVEIAPANFVPGGSLAGRSATLRDQGTNEATDSDGDPITHRSAPVILAAGQQNTDVDFGFKLPADANECGKGNNGVGNGKDPQPPGNPRQNDGAGTAPGNPGNKGGVKAGQEQNDASGPGIAKAFDCDPNPDWTMVFNTATGRIQVCTPSSPLTNFQKHSSIPGTTSSPAATQTGAGNRTPVATESKVVIDWTGSYGGVAVPVKVPQAPTWQTDWVTGGTGSRAKRT